MDPAQRRQRYPEDVRRRKRPLRANCYIVLEVILRTWSEIGRNNVSQFVDRKVELLSKYDTLNTSACRRDECWQDEILLPNNQQQSPLIDESTTYLPWVTTNLFRYGLARNISVSAYSFVFTRPKYLLWNAFTECLIFYLTRPGNLNTATSALPRDRSRRLHRGTKFSIVPASQ